MKRLKTEPEKELTKAELEVMQILWKLKKAFVGDILDRMVEPKPAYNTVSTVVRLLEKKGVVGHESFGKSHRYYPLVDKETYADSYVRRVMGNFFDGSLSNLVSFFTEREDLSLAESERVIRLAEEAIRKRKDAVLHYLPAISDPKVLYSFINQL